MSYSITIPRLGWSMEEGVFGQWLKSPGEFVQAGEMIFLLEGEKAVQEIESIDSGFLCIPPDAPKTGASVKVGEVIGFLLAEGEPAPSTVQVERLGTSLIASPENPLRSESPSSSAASLASRPRVAGPAARRLAREMGIDLSKVATPDPTGRVQSDDIRRSLTVHHYGSTVIEERKVFATPRARRRARELGMDWSQLLGTGRAGRIRERDVLAASLTPSLVGMVTELQPSLPGHYVQANKLRRATAERMRAAVHQAAPVTLTTKVNAQSLVSYRERLKLDSNNGTVPSYNDILMGLVAQTLRELPALNACWQGDKIYIFDEIHIATAIDTPDGLLAPVVRNADRLTLVEIATQTKQFIELARLGRLKHEHLCDGTFTVTNLGMFGVDTFTPILNLPQVAILGIGRIVEEPVVRVGRLEIGQTMSLSLTVDHRVIDGAPAARWLQSLGQRIFSIA